MWDTTITIQRPPNTVFVGTDGRSASGIPVQVDQVSDKEQLDAQLIYKFQGVIIYKVYVPWHPNSLVLQQDLLIDERVTDADRANTPYRYRVIGRPKNYLYDHQTCYCIVEVGN